MRPLVVLALGACLASPAPALAQRIIGTVLLPDGQTPAGGVLVEARDPSGRAVAQAVSGAEGRFTLFVDSAVALNLRLHREGHHPTEGETRTLAGDEVADVIATLLDRPVRLASIPRGASSCGRADDGRAAVELLLEEARKAFLIAQASIGRDDLQARVATFDHRTAKNGEDTLRTVVRRASGPLPSLFRATTVEELEEQGFFATIGGERVFRALEPALLASPWFTSTHCFTLVAPRDSALRLDFTPRRERRGLVDVEGSYWFDPGTLELLGVDYRYQGLREEERRSGASVQMEFARAATGERVVTAWRQRVPLLGYRMADGATTFVRTQMTLVDIVGHRTTGGQVTAVLREGAPILLVAPLPEAVARTPFGVACPEQLDRRATGAAAGRLSRPDSLPVGGVLLKVRWTEPVVVDRTTLTEREQLRETVTEADGTWRICDLPVRRPLTLVWDERGTDVTVPFTVPEAATVVTVERPATP